jgi:predicted dehydrogenase
MISRRTALSFTAASLSVGLVKSSFGAAAAPLRYLQIGIGHAHSTKIDVYRDSADWEVVGIVEEDPALRAKAEKNPKFKDYPFLSLEEGLNTPNLRVVGIETEVRDLLRYAEIAVKAGLNLHLDKPAGSDLAKYRAILDIATTKGLVVQMGYMFRYNPAVQLLHEMLAVGWLGEIFETHAVMSKVIPPAERLKLAEFSGGTMFELGCHIIDLTIGVLGPPDQVRAFPRSVLGGNGDTFQDNMLAVFEYPKATATVKSSGVEVEGFLRRQFTVCGTEGTFHIQPLDKPSVTLSLSKERTFGGSTRVYPKGTSLIKFESPYQRYVGDAADLAAILRGEKENHYPVAYDLAVQESVLAASGMPF